MSDEPLSVTASNVLHRLAQVGRVIGRLAIEARGALVCAERIESPETEALKAEMYKRLQGWETALDAMGREMHAVLAEWSQPWTEPPGFMPPVMGMEDTAYFGGNDPSLATAEDAEQSFVGALATLQFYRRVLRLCVGPTTDVYQAQVLPPGRIETVMGLLGYVRTMFDVFNRDAYAAMGGGGSPFPLSSWACQAAEWRKTSGLDWEDNWTGEPLPGAG
jgi:hypothetical protein